jgi:hypothetical protein
MSASSNHPLRRLIVVLAGIAARLEREQTERSSASDAARKEAAS